MNWGKGIALTFVIFCTGMIAVVYRSFQEDVDLVTEDYYKEELAYQQKIDQAGQVRPDAKLKLIQTQESIRFTFPDGQKPTGQIHFYKPDNPDLDKTFEISDRVMEVTKTLLTNGKYRVKVTWKSEGTTYYQEEILFI